MLKEFRKQRGLTQIQASGLIGYPPRTLRRWENGESRVPLAVIQKIKEAYGLTDQQTILLVSDLTEANNKIAS